jgi:hypothetical protein
MDWIDGLAAGDPVTAEQIRALFGCGLHPLAELRQQQLEGPDLPAGLSECVSVGGAVQDRRQRSDSVPARGGQAHRGAQQRHRTAGRRLDRSSRPGPGADSGGRSSSSAEHGREPVNAPELMGQIAKDSRPRIQTVAGYDLTFSPVKSVSTLWAVADSAVAAAIERAHSP